MSIKVQELGYLNGEKIEIICEYKESLNHKKCGGINEETKHLGVLGRQLT